MLTNDHRAELGLAAMRAGDPDHEANRDDDDLATSATDAIANVLHAVCRELDTNRRAELAHICGSAIDHAMHELHHER